ncbi:DUF1217 domain-containing protein [Falsiroseomonas tokyonensis]|uniref:DUF1217 domain-containing protein n=1 Tax=Falsiroseomonas tokyonensis TaxID=430521 RepID=A0ABV7C0J4_9PROT|nr:DUF1217 domain-containing protein [Falsiroseomonas tokyonensis]MBU8540783.1 DUF1217 domain-containing protein [Falsiroseomonas tokyonensis]
MLPGLGALTALAVAQREGANLQARFTARRDNEAAMARFREAATQHQDVESLLQDRRTLGVMLEAFQLEGEINKRGILRKILTEDPAAEGSLANRLTDRRWRELARAFATRETSTQTTTEIAALSTTAIGELSLARVSGLSTDQLRALTSAQVQALDAAQVAAIGSSEIAALDAGDLRAMDATQVAALRPSQLSALRTAQLAAIDAADFARLGVAQLRALSTTQMAAVATSQLAALGTEQLAAFSASQARALGTAQRAALQPAQLRALGTFGPPTAAEEAAAAALEQRSPFADSALLDRVVADAMTNRYEKSMGEANAGLREALYFLRNASKITSMTELMSDKAMTAVVRGALGLPESFGVLEFDQQKSLLTARVNLDSLKDPKEAAKLAQRYLALSAPSQSASNPVLALFGGGGSSLNSLIGSGLSLSA